MATALNTNRTHTRLSDALRLDGGTADQPLAVDHAELSGLVDVTSDVLFREHQLGLASTTSRVLLSARVQQRLEDLEAGDPELGVLAAEEAVSELVEECFVRPDSGAGSHKVVHVVTHLGRHALVVDLA